MARTLGYNHFPWPGSSVGRAEDWKLLLRRLRDNKHGRYSRPRKMMRTKPWDAAINHPQISHSWFYSSIQF